MLQIVNNSGIYTLTAKQELGIKTEDAWNFFSKPVNLGKITPSYMGFKITSKNVERTYAGQIITYKIGVLPFIKTNWVTEITHVTVPNYFVDEQRVGPYQMWHHEHIFKQLANGNVLMTDRVSYKPPYGFLGHILHALFIKNQIKKIFTYRYNTLAKLFPK